MFTFAKVYGWVLLEVSTGMTFTGFETRDQAEEFKRKHNLEGKARICAIVDMEEEE